MRMGAAVAYYTLVTACLFAVGKHAIGFYLGRTAMASVYGTAGSVLLIRAQTIQCA